MAHPQPWKRIQSDRYINSEDANKITDYLIKKHNIELILPNSQAVLNTDPIFLTQIIINLISNSSYVIKDKNEKCIKIDYHFLKNSQLKITVQDSGLYTDIKTPNLIFDPLVTSKSPAEGTGLGLSLSKTMAQKMGGDLYLDPSETNTTFVLILNSGV